MKFVIKKTKKEETFDIRYQLKLIFTIFEKKEKEKSDLKKNKRKKEKNINLSL